MRLGVHGKALKGPLATPAAPFRQNWNMRAGRIEKSSNGITHPCANRLAGTGLFGSIIWVDYLDQHPHPTCVSEGLSS
jgi:hypothetical protein